MTDEWRTDAPTPGTGTESEEQMARRLAKLDGESLVREIIGMLHRMDERYIRLLKRLFIAMTILAVFLLGSLAASVVAIKRSQNSDRDAINRNKQGVLVSCTLLANAIIESGGASSSADATKLFVTAIQRVMTPKERAAFAKTFTQPKGLAVPPCKEIAEHPESVAPAK